ncbi:MAG: EAL domain-containing protein [Myxococcaceae bacterium]|nr:EAL domain-containing protein [Myxococcaceae bacterium]MCI0672785.1 EAL domain-containing protein [Myxococcaceae bacterium]
MFSLVPPPAPEGSGLLWCFQPIVDVPGGAVLGHEVLTRNAAGDCPFDADLEPRARRQLERECLVGALRRMRSLGGELPSTAWFLNTSPEAVCAPGFPELLRAEAGPALLPQLVLELTEREEVADARLLQHRLHELAGSGVRVALDDFGAGHSGLLTLVHTMPAFLKLDMSLIRALNLHPYRQHLVRALVAFAANVEAVLVAEGVEAWDELETLLAVGVRHAQGYLVGRPAALPGAVCPAFEAGRVRLLARTG